MWCAGNPNPNAAQAAAAHDARRPHGRGRSAGRSQAIMKARRRGAFRTATLCIRASRIAEAAACAVAAPSARRPRRRRRHPARMRCSPAALHFGRQSRAQRRARGGPYVVGVERTFRPSLSTNMADMHLQVSAPRTTAAARCLTFPASCAPARVPANATPSTVLNTLVQIR